MAITNLDDLALAMAGGAQRLSVNKVTMASAVAGSEMSLWRTIVFPLQGAMPTAAAICTSALTGAMILPSRTGDQVRYLASADIMNTNAGNCLIIEDRLAHMGGLNGTLTTAQTVDVSLDTLADNIPARCGAANYMEVEWYLDWYAATGSTAATPTVDVTYHDDTTATLNVWAAGATALPGSVAIGRRYKIIPGAKKGIKSVQAVTLSASTGTVGNFGVTAVRRLCLLRSFLANTPETYDWSKTGLPIIQDSACIALSMLCATATTGAVTGSIVVAVA